MKDAEPNFRSCKRATTPPPSSPALLPEGEGGKLPLPPGEGWGEGKRLIPRGFATDIEVATEELRLSLTRAYRA